MKKLLTHGKTDVIKGFVSNRTKRKFDAHLTFDPKEGKIGFEFPPREKSGGEKNREDHGKLSQAQTLRSPDPMEKSC